MTTLDETRARVCFFLTIYNESKALPKLLEQISKIKLPEGIEAYSIYAVDDASTDDTPQVLDGLKGKYPLTVLRYEKNKGVPKTFEEAFTYFAHNLRDEDIVVLMEADGTSDVSIAPKMLTQILEGSDIVIASRHVRGGKYAHFPWFRVLGSSLINLFLRVMWQVEGATDYTIFYRAYRARLIKKSFTFPHIRAKKSFAVNGEILLQLSQHLPQISEVPLVYDYGLKKGPSRMNLVAALKEYMRLTFLYRLNGKQIKKFFLSPIPLVALGSLVLHLVGITYGFPDLLVLDEPSLTRGALTMLKTQNLIPALAPADFSTLYYPPLTAYLYLLALIPVLGISLLLSGLSLDAYTTSLLLDPSLPWITTRAVSAIIGALAVLFLGRLAEKIIPGSGVYAALFLATSFLHITFSHIARHWSLSVLIVIFLLWCAYAIYRNGHKSAYITAGILSGVGLGTGVITLFFGIVPALAHFLRPGNLFSKIKDSYIWILGIAAVISSLFFFALYPKIYLGLLFSGAENQGVTLDAPKSLVGLLDTFVSSVRDLGQAETMVLIFSLIGIPLLLRAHKRFAITLILSSLLYVAAIYVGYYYLLHYLQLLIPIFAIFAGAAALEIISLAKARWIKIGLAILIFALPLSVAARFSYLWALPDSRHEARAYIERELPSDAKIISYVRDMKIVWPTKDAIAERIEVSTSSSRLLDTTLLSLSQGEYPRPAFNIFELATFATSERAKITEEFLRDMQFDYAVVDPALTPISVLNAYLQEGEIVAEFPKGEVYDVIANEFGGPSTAVFHMERMGPKIQIIKLP